MILSREENEQKPEPLLDGRAGYIVPCGMCGTEIWVLEYDDNLVYICEYCADELLE